MSSLSFSQVLWVGVGGFVGTVARYLVNVASLRVVSLQTFPLGTVIVNIVGCFLIGALGRSIELRPELDPTLRLVVLVGFLGGFTTFSAFAAESVALFQNGHTTRAFLNVVGQVVVGLAAAAIGYGLIRS